VYIRHAHSSREARDLRPVPRDRKKDGSVAENAEVVRVVCVFPDVLAREHKILPEGLLNPHMKFVSPPRAQGRRAGSGAAEKRVQDGVIAADTRDDQILVEWSFEHSRIRCPQDGIAAFNVVCDAQAWLGFLCVVNPL